ncbi:MAG: beta-ketoacyl synthase N-terminal-like domain-containing protein [Caldilineaceae bacterium]
MSTTKLDYAVLLKDALRKLDTMQSELDTLQRVKTEPIAIVGMACRFPGATTPEAFWQLLQNGVDTTRIVPCERWSADEYYADDRGMPGKTYVRHASFIDNVDQFDAHFFGISPQEAVSLDPQQRLLLEVSWEALERAGQAPQKLVGSQTGIFMGIGQVDYAQQTVLNGNPAQIDIYAGTGSAPSVASGRLSFVLGVHGPNMAVDTACSASLVAVHLASQSLRLGECNLALAGGVQLMLSPLSSVGLAQMQALSPDGRCKTFDAKADGYGRGEGCGVVILKRLSDAQRDGDSILAVIRGSAVNHDGPSSGLTVPNRVAQEALMRRALQNAQIEAESVGYIEAHGTGTSLGDPIELRALTSVYGKGRVSPLWVGSVKTNIGHLEAAAGIAGLIKVVLALQHGEIPPHLHLQTPTPHFDWEKFPLQIPIKRTLWPNSTECTARIAGISSFGLSGTNAHVILSNAPSLQPRALERATSNSERPWQILTLSAKNEVALSALIVRYQEYLASASVAKLGDLCYTANSGRNHFAYRVALVTQSTDQLSTQFTAIANGQSALGIHCAYFPEHQSIPKIAFLFTGQGAQYINMGRKLYETQPTFRQTLDRCDEILREYLGGSILSVLYPTGKQHDENHPPAHRPPSGRIETAQLGTEPGAAGCIDQTAYTQPALFALEYALAMLWKSWGIEPTICMGHSVGEVAAACVAGVFSLEDGLKLIAARGRLMQALPQDGSMVAVMADEATVAQLIAPYRQQVDIASINGPQNVVISGQRQVLEEINETFATRGIKTRPLTVSHAFHSPLMEPMLAEFAEVAKAITYYPPRIAILSNVTGQIATDTLTDWQYWVRHVRNPVRFADGVVALQDRGIDIFLEIGPKPTLLGMAKSVLDSRALSDSTKHDPESTSLPSRVQKLSLTETKPKIVDPLLLPSLREGHSDWQQILESLAKLYVQGADVCWDGFEKGYQRHKAILPTYPFQRQRYWVESRQSAQTLVTPVKTPVVLQGIVHQPDNLANGRNNGTVSRQQPLVTRGEQPPLRQVILNTAPEARQAKIQDYLGQVIEKAVGIPISTLTPEQSMTNVGLDSLMIMGIKQQIQRELGVKVPVENLLQGISIQQLALQARSNLDPIQTTSAPPGVADALVAIQPEGKKPPFFCVHPIGGVVFPYYRLAALLGKEQPVYGLQAVEVNGRPSISIEQMATTYIAAIRSVQPQGPYFLGGWSFGALVAYEMARQLDLAGASIGLTVSLDQAAPAEDKFVNTWKGLQFLVTTGIPNIWPYAREYMQWSSQSSNRSATRQQYHSQAMGTMLRIMRANGQSIFAYQPAPYRGPITLFQTTAQLRNTKGELTWGWHKLAQGGVIRIEVPGHHMNLLNDPHVNVLAEKLRIVLQQAQKTVGVTA